MSFTEEKKIDILKSFVGGRLMSDDTMLLLSTNLENGIEETVYRGMPFPKHLIKEGYVLEEWNGSSHWSLDLNIARNFSKDKFNISEDYCEELAEELGMSYEEVEDNIFVPVVLKLNGVSEGIRTYDLVKGLDIVDIFYKEKEITTIGIDTKIKSFEKKTDSYGEYHLIEVEEVI